MANKIAGIDVHKKVLMVVVLDGAAPGEKPERRRFSTMPTELRHLATWLRERGVMVIDIAAAGFAAALVNQYLEVKDRNLI